MYIVVFQQGIISEPPQSVLDVVAVGQDLAKINSFFLSKPPFQTFIIITGKC
jgi:hypothetical protein